MSETPPPDRASADAPAKAAPAPGATRDRSRLDRYIGLRRESRDPWISRYASHLRIGLPLAALVGVLGGLVAPMVFDTSSGFRLSGTRIEAGRGEYLAMVNPHFTGSDRRDRPYTVTGVRGSQKDRDVKEFELVEPRADLSGKDNRWLSAEADLGRYAQRSNTLDLEGNVNLFEDRGYQFSGERLRIDLTAGSAVSDRPVQAQGPRGVASGEGLRVVNRGEIVEFTGRARVLLSGVGEPKEKQDEARSPEAAPTEPTR